MKMNFATMSENPEVFQQLLEKKNPFLNISLNDRKKAEVAHLLAYFPRLSPKMKNEGFLIDWIMRHHDFSILLKLLKLKRIIKLFNKQEWFISIICLRSMEILSIG